MSYILDALRRADAQREPEPARGIHAQPAAALPAPGHPAAARWAWPAGAAALLLAGGWVLWQQAAPPQPSAPVLPVARPAAVVPVAAALLPAAPPPLPTPAVERVAQRAVLKAPAPAAGAEATAAKAQPPAAAASASTTATPQAAPPAAPVAAPRILSVAELPAAIKGELPKLAITGGVWSEDPGQRLLIVGGKVVSEGAELAPGVMLEQIRSRSAVMRFKGLRYSVGF